VKIGLIILLFPLLFSCKREDPAPSRPPSLPVEEEKVSSPMEDFLQRLNPAVALSARYKTGQLSVIQTLDPEVKSEEVIYQWQELAVHGLSVFGPSNRMVLTIREEKPLFTVVFHLARTRDYVEKKISFRQYLGTAEVELIAPREELSDNAVSLLAYLAGARDGVFDVQPQGEEPPGDDHFRFLEDQLVEGNMVEELYTGLNGPFEAPQSNVYYVFTPVNKGEYQLLMTEGTYFFRVLNVEMQELAAADPEGALVMTMESDEPYFLEIFSKRGSETPYWLTIQEAP